VNEVLLARRLRVLVITDRGLAEPRSVVEVVEIALEAGARAVQLRAKDSGAGGLLELARSLRRLTRRTDSLLFVNDRLDVALCAGADGAHLGPHDLPLTAARKVVPKGFLLGFSTDDPERARGAERDGADYVGCGSVWTTETKDVGGEAIGTARLRAVVEAVSIPVLAIGGVTPGRAPEVAAVGAAGVAVASAVMGAEDPALVVRGLLAAFVEERE
jgi:thiamine-phosphate pyrophosphorylase